MSTQKQIDVARRNGALSRGPITPEGKATSARNAINHGLCADFNTSVIHGEDKEYFQEMLAAMIAEHNPVTHSETILVECMAAARWRQMRVQGLEVACFNKKLIDQEINSPEIAAHDPATRAYLVFQDLADNSKVLHLMNRYETRFERLYERSLKLLEDRRHKKRQCETNRISEPAAQPETAPVPNEPDSPTPNASEIAPVPNEPDSATPNASETAPVPNEPDFAGPKRSEIAPVRNEPDFSAPPA